MSELKICDLTRNLAFLVFSCVSEPSARLPAGNDKISRSIVKLPRRVSTRPLDDVAATPARFKFIFHTESVRMSLLPKWFDEATTRTLKLRVKLQILDHLRLELRLAGLEVRAEAVGFVFFS